jgi:hypothetical protein
VIDTRMLVSRQPDHNRYAPAPRPAGKSTKRAEANKNAPRFGQFCGKFSKE